MLAWSFYVGLFMCVCKWYVGEWGYISIISFTFCPKNMMGKKEFAEQKTSLVTVLCLSWCNAWDKMWRNLNFSVMILCYRYLKQLVTYLNEVSKAQKKMSFWLSIYCHISFSLRHVFVGLCLSTGVTHRSFYFPITRIHQGWSF